MFLRRHCVSYGIQLVLMRVVFFFQICIDIDECSEDPPKCATESKCINTMVSIFESASRGNLPVCVCVSFFICVYLCFCLPASQSGCQSFILSESVCSAYSIFFVCSSLRQSVSPSVSQSVSQSVSPSVRQSVSPSVRQSVSPSVRQSVSPSVRQSVSPSVRQSVSPSVRQPVSQSASQSVSQSVSSQ